MFNIEEKMEILHSLQYGLDDPDWMYDEDQTEYLIDLVLKDIG